MKENNITCFIFLLFLLARASESHKSSVYGLPDGHLLENGHTSDSISECSTGFVVKGSCYFVSDKRFSFSDSKSSCETFGSQVSEIKDVETYKAVVENLRLLISKWNSTKGNFWVGITAIYNLDDPTNQVEIKTLNGDIISSDLQWYSRFPMTSYQDWNKVALHVKLQVQNPKQGLFNHPERSRMRALCSKDIQKFSK